MTRLGSASPARAKPAEHRHTSSRTSPPGAGGTATAGRRTAGHVRRRRRRLGGYTDALGAAREIVIAPGAAGSALVIDRNERTGLDQRLLAHLGADEPFENALIVCRSYLEDEPDVCRCRPLTDADLRLPPFLPEPPIVAGRAADSPVVDHDGNTHRLEPVYGGMSIPELRWRRAGCPEAVLSVRQIVAQLESYEPVCGLTARALSRLERREDVSTTVLRLELTRVQESPIVLNRRLREKVLATVAHGQLSMSEIALRCGRVKRDGKGNESGETSWLARRLGLLPEGGGARATPWIHSDVLALIARRGLGISPREVEL
jgi:hypothetical protein